MSRLVIRTMIILLLSTSLAVAHEGELHIGKFSSGDQTGWKEQTIGLFKPKTVYTLTRDNDRTVLMATSKKAASGLVYSLNNEAKDRPILKWSWRIEHTFKKGDERTKDGEDFAARVYVIFPRGMFSRMRAISYVWANKLPKGEHVASPFSNNIITIAVDSGDELTGRWTFHQRNILDDYRTFFHEEPPKVGGIAIMTDTDNTAESVIAWYGDIFLAPAPKGIEERREQPAAINHKTQESPKDIRPPATQQIPAPPQASPGP